MKASETSDGSRWLLKVETSHNCTLPSVIDEERHRELTTALEESRMAQWKRYEEYNSMSALERRKAEPPRDPRSGSRSHSCDEDRCRTIRDGSVWQCECGLVYELENAVWRRVSLLQPIVSARSKPRTRTSPGSSTTGAAVLGFAAGALVV